MRWLAFIFPLCNAPAHAADDVLAGLRWGMSVDAAAAALGERAERLDPPIDYGVGQARLFARGVKVGDTPLTAFYQFDGEGRLRQVLLERRWSARDTSVHLTFMDFTGAAMTLDPSKDFLDPRLPSTEYETFKRRAFPRRIVRRYFPTAEKELAGPPACE